jgi:hypothetical protein
LQNAGLETARGILVNEYLQTSQPDVYAVGDCAELRHPRPGRRAVEAIWYTGRMMGETAAFNIMAAEKRRKSVVYDPGIWFNSAKFFDIEYQVYGDIKSQMPEHQADIYWEHPGGKKSVRVRYEQRTGVVVGFNLMGVRYRQEVCEQWIRQGAHIESVLQNLGLANFDPEFSVQHESEVLAVYNRRHGKNLSLQQRRGLPAVLRFLTKSVA